MFAGVSHSYLDDCNTFPHHLLSGTLDPSRSGHHSSLASGAKILQSIRHSPVSHYKGHPTCPSPHPSFKLGRYQLSQSHTLNREKAWPYWGKGQLETQGQEEGLGWAEVPPRPILTLMASSLDQREAIEGDGQAGWLINIFKRDNVLPGFLRKRQA